MGKRESSQLEQRHLEKTPAGCRAVSADTRARLVIGLWKVDLLAKSGGCLLHGSEIGRDLQCLFIGHKCFRITSGLRQDAAHSGKGFRGRLQFDGTIEIADRFIELALFLRNESKTEPGIELPGIVAKRLLVACPRAFVVP